MITLVRSLNASAVLRQTPARMRALTGMIAIALIALLIAAGSASAIVTTVSGTSVGLQPRRTSETLTEGSPETFANEAGNAVLHGTNVYAVYWDPANSFHHEWLTKIDNFFQQLGAGSGSLDTIFSELGQYRDRSNLGALYQTVFKGAYSDTAKFPTPAGCTDPNPLKVGQATCLTDAQLRQQLQSFIASHSLPTGMNTIYYIMTPPGVTVCVDAAATSCSDYKVSKTEEEKDERKSVSYQHSFCSYHGDINPDNATEGDASTVLYAAIPWSVGTLGLSGYAPSSVFYEQGFDCQDGGWNPEGGEERREQPRERTKEENEAFATDTLEAQQKIEEEIRLEGAHQEEPNQEGKGESEDYSAGLADLIIGQIAEEQANTVTDPMLNGWHDAEGHEVTDECRNTFAGTVIGGNGEGGITGLALANLKTDAGTLSNTSVGSGRYYINNAFDLSEGDCVGGVGLVPRFTAPNPVNVNEIVGFDGMESTVSLEKGKSFGPSGPPTTTYATFSWNFGDGSAEVKGYAPGAPLCEAPWLSPCAASIFHAYKYGGKYQVKLTVTDVAGNVSEVEHEVTVNGPAAPGSASSTSTSSSSTSAAGASGAGAAAVPNPVLAASVLSRSLRTVLRSGLLVQYSVNEQVAGHFDVLLSRSLADRLHIGGAPAFGLPKGSLPQVIIAKSVLVTTKGGRNKVEIKFSKRVASLLAHVKNLSVMLRLVAHNAATGAPVSATVVSVAKLSR